ncbi:hypothetical protein [Endozoicomonas sp. ONNA1]|uniref:hypothetical protein n=1 Tax=Endozoicomonas sp. ONNA1 TaxID=2828740 RepID=UPI002148A846|nr:hypothetical protein [Endozoicomonas sp. ONNA1]
MICEQTAKYCEEWAADFEQQDMLQTAGFWMAIAYCFKKGPQITTTAEVLEDAIKTMQKQIEFFPIALKIVKDPHFKKQLETLQKEKLFVLPKLQQLLSETKTLK